MLIAIVGAESTGKSALAAQLQQALMARTGLRCARVDEHLRAWCEQAGRTPQAHEQAAIAATQREQIESAALTHELVICDTTPLMTAIYSELLFQDTSLHEAALRFQARCDLTLLTGLDLPWVADGLQRDGPQVRAPVDAALRRALRQAALSWSVVHGLGSARLETALNAITPMLLQHAPTQASGLFGRLLAREAGLPAATRWTCEHCDQADCEHASLALRSKPTP
ncbi:AAA family ATPase [Paucibacter soli]|uniref:AAA family ATPase n=1 Tax=Paucibacter soli TaxID=3133433 RepID=UPI0030B1D919